MKIILENSIIKKFIRTLSQIGPIEHRMTTNGIEFYKRDNLFGKLSNEQLYLLYKTSQLTEVSEQDIEKLQVILKDSYLIVD